MVIAETVCGRQTIWATHIGQLGDNAPDCFMYFVYMFFSVLGKTAQEERPSTEPWRRQAT